SQLKKHEGASGSLQRVIHEKKPTNIWPNKQPAAGIERSPITIQPAALSSVTASNINSAHEMQRSSISPTTCSQLIIQHNSRCSCGSAIQAAAARFEVAHRAASARPNSSRNRGQQGINSKQRFGT
ncbi:hypothetical protein Dimus_026957, partial [Dionaea muscipula]